MEKIEKISKLIDQKKFVEAKKVLLGLRRKDYHDPIINYHLGKVCNDWRNPNRSIEEAKKYFRNTIDSEHPIEEAFIELSTLEENTNHKKRIVKKGLESFPKSVNLYKKLLYVTEIFERDSIFEEIAGKGIDSEEISAIKINTYFEQKRFEEALVETSRINVTRQIDLWYLYMLKALCYFEINDLRAEKIFKKLIEEDINHRLDFTPYFGLMLCYLKQDQKEKAFEVLKEIPEEAELDPVPLFIQGLSLYLDFQEYFLQTCSIVENATKNTRILGKIRGLRGKFLSSFKNDEKIDPKMIADLKYANKIFPQNIKFCEELKSIAETRNNYFEAYKYHVQLIKNVTEEEYWGFGEQGFIKEAKAEEFLKITNDLKKILVENRGSTFRERIVKTTLTAVIKRLAAEKKFDEVVQLVEKVSEQILEKSEILFEIAYAYGEIKNHLLSKKYYELHIKECGITSSVANNLGVIFESGEDFIKAQDFYQQAVSLEPNDEIAGRNLKRVTDIIEEKKSTFLEFKKASEEFNKENPWVQSKLLSFSKFKNSDGVIICSYRQLPQFFGIASLKVNDLIKELLEKKYVMKVVGTRSKSSNIYRINPEIEKILDITSENLEHETEFLRIAERINSNELRKIGYDENVINALKKVSSEELRKMLERDLKENALALLVGLFKAVLMFSGSIVESILLYKIVSKNITAYMLENGKNKQIIDMSLGSLLYVANKEKIIDDQLFHLAHVLKGYRNLIHPGVEQRKKAPQINEENAQLSWNITRKIIIEI